MSNSYRIIDEKTWERSMHCMVFRNSVEPAFCVTFETDITNFYHMVKNQGLSFTLAMVYAVCKCANKIEAFRYRFLDGQVVLYDRIDTAFTYLNKETNLFKVVNVPMIDDVNWHSKRQMNRKYILQDRWEMMFFNVRQCLGLHILIYRIQIQARKIMPHLFLIGGNTMKIMVK